MGYRLSSIVYRPLLAFPFQLAELPFLGVVAGLGDDESEFTFADDQADLAIVTDGGQGFVDHDGLVGAEEAEGVCVLVFVLLLHAGSSEL
jgi:hypothetical protein